MNSDQDKKRIKFILGPREDQQLLEVRAGQETVKRSFSERDMARNKKDSNESLLLIPRASESQPENDIKEGGKDCSNAMVRPEESATIISTTSSSSSRQSLSSFGRPAHDYVSVGLMDTYQHINALCHIPQDQPAGCSSHNKDEERGTSDLADAECEHDIVPRNVHTRNSGWDDDHYDYIITLGELLGNRYKINEVIGKGSFGQVVRAFDIVEQREVAIKITKSKRSAIKQGICELQTLRHLGDKQSDDEDHNIVRLLTQFMYRNHICFVFELLSMNLYQLLQTSKFAGFPLNVIKKFAKQLLHALAFLGRPDVDVIHCDLKPENIVLRHSKKTSLKVIDFGSSCRSKKRNYTYIQSRYYRSPEVMLGLPYSTAIDMWSLGCVLVEMHTGRPLFAGSNPLQQMEQMVKVLGMIPQDMLERSSPHLRFKFFDRKKGQPDWSLRQRKRKRDEQECIAPSSDPMASLSEIIMPRRTGARLKIPAASSRQQQNSPQNYELFIDLVYKMLAYRPEERITPNEALKHPFLTRMAVANETTSAPPIPL